MPSVPKTARKKHSEEKVALILRLRKLCYSISEIANSVQLSRSTVSYIVHRAAQKSGSPYCPTKRPGRVAKLDARARRALIRHVERNPNDNLAALGTPSKTEHKLARKTVQTYLKATGYLRFKAQKKPFLTQKHKDARLHWAREHVKLGLDDWKRAIWTDEATFETSLDLRTCYVTWRPGTAIKSRYQKPTFKSGRTTVGIWGAITWGKKGPVYFLIKQGRMTSEI